VALHVVATGVAVVSLVGRPPLLVALAAVTCLAVETVLAVRVGLDARLFAHAAAHPPDDLDASELDQGLFTAGLVADRPVSTRSWSARIAGARRLFRAQALAAGAQVLVLLLGAWGPW
jgi:hypothetical protein